MADVPSTFLGFPIRVHRPCSEPDCPICIEHQIILGRPGGSRPVGIITAPGVVVDQLVDGCDECGRTAYELSIEGHAVECSEYL